MLYHHHFALTGLGLGAPGHEQAPRPPWRRRLRACRVCSARPARAVRAGVATPAPGPGPATAPAGRTGRARQRRDAWTPQPAALGRCRPRPTVSVAARAHVRPPWARRCPLRLPGERARKPPWAMPPSQRPKAVPRPPSWTWPHACARLGGAAARPQRPGAGAKPAGQCPGPAADAARRYQAGDMARAEHFQAEAGVAQAQALLAETQGASHAAQLVLQALVGDPRATTV